MAGMGLIVRSARASIEAGDGSGGDARTVRRCGFVSGIMVPGLLWFRNRGSVYPVFALRSGRCSQVGQNRALGSKRKGQVREEDADYRPSGTDQPDLGSF